MSDAATATATAAKSTIANPLRAQVLQVYKQLLHLSRDYPRGQPYFRRRLRAAFAQNSKLTNPQDISGAIDRANFVRKEIEAL